MKTYVHLSADECLRIYELSQEGLSQGEIARRLGRDKATISRELRRNQAPAGYLPDVAQRRYQARRQRCRPRPRLSRCSCRGSPRKFLPGLGVPGGEGGGRVRPAPLPLGMGYIRPIELRFDRPVRLD